MNNHYASDKLSHLVCKHFNEWAYSGEYLRGLMGDLDKFYTKALKKHAKGKTLANQQELDTLKQERLDAFEAKVEQLALWEGIDARTSSYLSKYIDGVLATSPVSMGGYLTYKFGRWLYERIAYGDKKEEEIPLSPFPIANPVVYHFHPVSFVQQMRRIFGVINHTFDGKYIATGDEVYINVIAPKNRNLQGPLVVFDSSGILFKTHSLCRGSNGNKLKAGGDGDTPTGKASTWYAPIVHKGEFSYGNYGLIYLNGLEGDFKQATKNGRAGIAIHCGHTSGYFKKSLEDKGKLMGTHGCVRVYNNEMKKLGELYTELISQGKKIYCYIEEYEGNINDIYKFYNLKNDSKDKSRGKRSSNQ